MFSYIFAQFTKLPVPDQDCSGRTIIVTGANVGLGLEASRHFVRLNAAKVILACRSAEKGEVAKADIEASTKRLGVVEVWPLDLSSFDSVKEFGKRAEKLDRLDILINNAGVAAVKHEMVEGHEISITVNVLSTFLLSLLLLPVLRRTGEQFKITPHLAIVSSDICYVAFFNERKEKHIYPALQANKSLNDRYATSKLMQIILTKHLSIAADCSGKSHVHISCLHPGLCNTQLFRDTPFPVNLVLRASLLVAGRSPEVGSRCLLAAAFAPVESEGKYSANGVVAPFPKIMSGDEGEEMQSRLWEQTCELLNEISPGVVRNI